MKERMFGGLRVVMRCRDAAAPVLYGHDLPGELAADWTLVSLSGADWGRDLTPWPAKSIFRGQPDFAGGAAAHLKRLAEEIIPWAEEGLKPRFRAIMGYSLAGLFAVYAAAETGLFDAAASVSGSMWYPGFAQYIEEKQPVVRLAYFSVGEREKRSRHRAFQSIEECTRQVLSALRARGVKGAFELNPGGHFDAPDDRMCRAADWLKCEMRECTIES